MGRKPKDKSVPVNVPDSTEVSTNSDKQISSLPADQPVESASNFESADPVVTLDGQTPHPDYVKKGPIITNGMFEKWTPDLLNLRPVRSTRNANPRYID